MEAAPESSGSATQSGPIAVYGATGYTGNLVARELRRRGIDFLIAGRNRAKLEALSAQLGGARSRVASLDDAAALREMLESCAAVIGCAGPFTLHGEPLVSAAAEVGTHYIDTTGEQGFMKMVFDRYGERAAQSGAALLPAMGFDYAPGDLLAARTAEGMGPLDEIVIAYCVRGFRATRGTALSTIEILSGGDLVWHGGGWRRGPSSADGGRWRFPEPIGEQRTLRYPAGEQITVPRHLETEQVRTLLSGMMVPPALGPILSLTMPLLGLTLRTPLRDAAEALIRRLPEGPDEASRAKTRFLISCEARAGSRARRGAVTGGDPYGLTAAITVEAALRCTQPSFERSGALAPAQAFEPQAFLDSLSEFGVSTELEPLPEAAAAR
jgi:short subunit dehydrogenase-like uncharacterized protein